MTLILNPDHTDDEILELQKQDAEERALQPQEVPKPRTSYLPIPVPKPEYESDKAGYGRVAITLYAVLLLAASIAWFVYMLLFNGPESEATPGVTVDAPTGLAPGAFVLGALYVSAFFAGLGLLSRKAWALLLAWPVHIILLLASPLFFLMGNIALGVALAGDGTSFGIYENATQEGIITALVAFLAISAAIVGCFVLFNKKIRQSIHQ
jgi:hypothetical protein